MMFDNINLAAQEMVAIREDMMQYFGPAYKAVVAPCAGLLKDIQKNTKLNSGKSLQLMLYLTICAAMELGMRKDSKDDV